ncbi:hypothetical protein [Pseudoalteromonas phage PHS3]|nr:hypothetical protein [Pseudoalteromonas phage PHS3]
MITKSFVREAAISMCDAKLSIRLGVIKKLVDKGDLSQEKADKISLDYHVESMEERKRIREYNQNIEGKK